MTLHRSDLIVLRSGDERSTLQFEHHCRDVSTLYIKDYCSYYIGDLNED